MISGISAVSTNVQRAVTRFDDAASRVVASANVDDSSDATAAPDLATAITEMMSAQLAARATLDAALTINETVDSELETLG